MQSADEKKNEVNEIFLFFYFSMTKILAIVFCLATTIFVDKSIASHCNITNALMTRPKYSLRIEDLSGVGLFEWGPECLQCGTPGPRELKSIYETIVPTSNVVDVIPVRDGVLIISMEVADVFYAIMAANLIKEVYREEFYGARVLITPILYDPHIPDRNCDEDSYLEYLHILMV